MLFLILFELFDISSSLPITTKSGGVYFFIFSISFIFFIPPPTIKGIFKLSFTILIVSLPTGLLATLPASKNMNL